MGKAKPMPKGNIKKFKKRKLKVASHSKAKKQNYPGIRGKKSQKNREVETSVNPWL